MIVDAYYRCHAEVAEPGGATRMVRETIYCAVPSQSITEPDEAERAAWRLWRELVPYHRVMHVIVTGADVKIGGQWHQRDPVRPLHFDADRLRALCPPGSPYAIRPQA